MTRRQIIEWRERIRQAEIAQALNVAAGDFYPAGFTQIDKNDASGWQGCAVGEVYRKAGTKVRLMLDPRTLTEEYEKDGWWQGPSDPTLTRLGGEFSNVVDRNDFLRAYEIIDLIEARVLTLRYRRKAA